jgi:phage tail sheath protein FI
MYWPWGLVLDPLTRVEKAVPSSGAVAGCYVRSDKMAKEGVGAAPAGEERGKIYGWTGIERRNSRAVRDLLYPEGINPIAQFPESGVVIMGQRTLEQDATSTDRVNGRREMIFIETSIEVSSRFVVFRPNAPETWRELERAVVPFLAAEKDKGAITDYRFQCDESTNPPAARDAHELKARVFVKLTPTAEFIGIEFVKTDSGTSFTEIYGS